MKFANLGLSFACAGALALTQVAGAQMTGSQDQSTYGQQQGSMRLSRSDSDFLKKSAESSLASIKAGQLAQQKATDPNVKRFAQQQVQTHQNMYQQLHQIAQQHNVNLPTDMSSGEQRDYNRLTSASSREFDQQYTRWAADQNEETMESLRKQAERGQNPALKNFASSNLPTIQNQLQMAQGLQRSTASAAGQTDGMQQHGDQDQDDQYNRDQNDQPDQNPSY